MAEDPDAAAPPASPSGPTRPPRALPNPLAMAPNIRDPQRRERAPLMGIAKGLKTTLGVFFRRPVTFEYPEVKRPESERYRGRIGLELDLCIGCTLCAQACPNGTCFMVDQDFAYQKSDDMAKKFPNRKNIYPAVEAARCLYCALCEEACPTGAIHMTPEYELSDTHRNQVYMPDMLQRSEAEIDRLPPEEVQARFDKGLGLILESDAERMEDYYRGR